VDSSASGYLTPFWPYIKSGGSGPTFPDGDGYLNMVLWPAFGGFPADFWVYGSFATPPD
jgi:hypothetical protein